MTLTSEAVATTADRLLATLDARRQMEPLTRDGDGLSIADAYRVSRAVTARRVARGEQPIGRKIGFTNRTIWDEYGVHHPIDGPMYAHTVVRGDGTFRDVSIGQFVEPRIEPEIVLGLSGTPQPDMDESALMGCIGWIAHGFEIVQSLYPGWAFKGADCIAAFGLHGALFYGSAVAIHADQRAETLLALQRFEITLAKDGIPVDRGHAGNVLGGPVSALKQLVRAIAADPDAEPLRAGDVVTTGTVTRAFPVKAGERWTTTVEGVALANMDLSFVA